MRALIHECNLEAYVHAQVQLIYKYAGTLTPADYQQFFLRLPRSFTAAMRWLQDTPQHGDLFRNLCYLMEQPAAPAQAHCCCLQRTSLPLL